MGIGVRIKQLRKQAGMTQPELAERIGVHETTIRRWEQERDKGPDVRTVNLLADALNTTPEHLLSEAEPLISAHEDTSKLELVYEWGGKNRIALPNTPETLAVFERLVMSALKSSPTMM